MLQVQAIRLLVKRVTIWRDRVEAELHEVPVVEFERVISQEMKSCRALRRRGQKTTAVPDPRRNGAGTAVVEVDENWRGRQTQFQDIQIPPFVPPPGQIDYIPSFEVVQPFTLGRIANGEWVIRDPSAPQPEAAYHLANATPERPIKALAPLIDAMLLAGNMTMRGILRELQRRASSACHGRDLRANVRARLYWLRKRGQDVRVSPPITRPS